MQMRTIRTFSVVYLMLLLLFPRIAMCGPGAFSFTGNLHVARSANTVTMLDSGLVLVTGGLDGSGKITATAELYNPSTGIFSATGNMRVGRQLHTATLLNNGMVLITGGVDPSYNVESSAEIYNPATGTFAVTGSMHTTRWNHSATMLVGGKVLVAGGEDLNSAGITSAELYDPTTGIFSPTGNMNTGHYDHTATVLSSGLVLVAGGRSWGTTASAELYDVRTGAFTSVGNMKSARYNHTATLLNDGRVLLAGGAVDSPTQTAEIYDPATSIFTLTGSMSVPRVVHTSTLLGNGTVLIAGGGNNSGDLSSAELYDPVAGTFSATGSLLVARASEQPAFLPSGYVLVPGGYNYPAGGGSQITAERYQPVSLTPSGLTSISIGPATTWVPLGTTVQLSVTGTLTGGGTEPLTAVSWTSSSNAIAPVTNDIGNRGHVFGSANGTATVTACVGGICASTVVTVAPHSNFLIGSTSGDSSSSTFESYDDNGARLQTGNLSVSRSQHSTTLLNNGTMFVAGGSTSSGSWQILDMHGNAIGSGSLLNGFYGHLAVRLGNGNIFLGGGTPAPGAWEIHSPTGALVSSGSLLGKRTPGAGAVLLQNGNIWISASGSGNKSDECSWEIRSSTGAFVSNGTLQSCYASGKVFVLGNGDVLLVGGVNAPGTYEIRTQAGAFVRSGTLVNGFDGNSGAVQATSNNIFLFEQGYWEYIGFDANANQSFDTIGTLLDGRTGSRAVMTSTGNIFITGGNIAPATWEMYTPSGTTVTFHSSGNLFDTRYGGHTLTHF
jgi:large repetitive protein